MSRSAWVGLLVGSVAVAAGCGGAAGSASDASDGAPAKVAKKPAKSDFDPCEGAGPPEKVYEGVLREARCEQDLYLTMAATADALGTTCKHCHVQKAGGDPKDFDFPVMTDAKKIGNWMKHRFVDGLRQKDGSPVTCASCHVDRHGKPAAKFLGEPRDTKYAMEWMSLVMVNQFTLADGGKLKCKHCHGAAPGQPEFQKKVILEELALLPRRTDLPPSRGAPPAPSGEPASASPSAPGAAGPAPAPPAGAPAGPAPTATGPGTLPLVAPPSSPASPAPSPPPR